MLRKRPAQWPFHKLSPGREACPVPDYLCPRMNQYGKVAFHTLGCKLNFSETSTLARQFREAGYARVGMEERPDVLVINTCSVTEDADKKCRNIIHRAIRTSPEVFVAVVGCYAQLKPEAIASIPGVNLVLGAGEKFNLVQHIQATEKGDAPAIAVGEIKDVKTFVPSFSSADRTRTFLKVQDGCNYFCAFCTIPLARGRSRSATIAETLNEARKAADAGAKEIVLTGVNIGDFGTFHGETLFELLRQLEEVQGVERFRISSIEPNLLTREIIEFVAGSKKFMPHFHIPLQSGSDVVLSAMRRRYRTTLYAERIRQVKSYIPHACIGADIITGFPGETDALFDSTRNFILDLPLSYLHVFTYSERDNTTALRLAGEVPGKVRSERTLQLRLISAKKKRAFYEEYVGTQRQILWESDTGEEFMFGFTDNYIRVKKATDPTSVNCVEECILGAMDSEEIMAVKEFTPQNL